MHFCKVAVLTVAAIIAAGTCAGAQEFKLGASLRNYDFYRFEDNPGDDAPRRDTEFASFRLMPELSFGRTLKIETQMVLDTTSPAGSPAAMMTMGRASTMLPLNDDLNRYGIEWAGYFDRLNLRIHTSSADFTLGRQAISWGVNTIWPALDLFSPFPATRIDRDYKPGVDAARLTFPLGAHSEFQTIGAVLGDSLHRDGAGAALLRIGAGPADIGLMGGSFHNDTVAGGFVTINVAGTVLKSEASWTRTHGELDRIRRQPFWRGGFGLERQISSTVNLVAEAAYDGIGGTDALAYPALLASDQVRRSEISGLGRWEAGMIATWKFHPLVALTNVFLVNCNDQSAVWIPWLSWSTTSNSEIMLGAQYAIGKRPGAGGVLRSEYGSSSGRVLIGFKFFL